MDKIDDGYLVFNHGGYDGQYNYYIVKDFPLKGDFRDSFRYQRVLYPALVSLFSFGYPRLIPCVFILINLISIWIGMAVLLKLMGLENEVNLFLMVLYGLNIGFLIAVLNNLGTPLAVMFILVGIYYYEKNRIKLCIVFFSLSLLTMENAWLVLAPLVLWSLWKKEFRRAGLLSISVIPWIIWQLILGWKLGQIPIFTSAGFLDFPFKGLIDYFLMKPWKAENPEDLLRQINVMPFMFFILLSLIITGIQLFREKTLFGWLVFFHCLFALFLSYNRIWSHTLTSSTRVLCGLFPFLFLFYVQSKQKRLLSILIAGAWVMTILGLLRLAYLPQHTYFIIHR